MALTLLESAFTYRSESGGQAYHFTVVVDEQGNCAIRDIQGPFGPIRDSKTQVPEAVADDMQTALDQAKVMTNMVTVANGILVFTAETEKVVTLGTALANTNYRVVFSPEEFHCPKVKDKTTSGFTVELNHTYTGNLGYDVLV